MTNTNQLIYNNFTQIILNQFKIRYELDDINLSTHRELQNEPDVTLMEHSYYRFLFWECENDYNVKFWAPCVSWSKNNKRYAVILPIKTNRYDYDCKGIIEHSMGHYFKLDDQEMLNTLHKFIEESLYEKKI